MNGEIVTRDDLDAVLTSICPDAEIDDEYARFYQPSYTEIKDLLAKSWDPHYIRYGCIKPDWPLCYDFAELCAAKVREIAYLKRWDERPAFGVLRYTQSENRHAINFVVTSECQVKYFEPQTGEWMDQPKDWKSTENLYI